MELLEMSITVAISSTKILRSFETDRQHKDSIQGQLEYRDRSQAINGILNKRLTQKWL